MPYGKYLASNNRYDSMIYRRCGNSGIKLPALSLGWWHNFGSVDQYDNIRSIGLRAFDLGITHFDLANNYGPVSGSAEENFGKLHRDDLKPYRDEMIISTKAGYYMWPGPYGDWGSRKYLVASIDQSLKRLGLDYVDIFYHHRPDPETPLEETMAALDYIVRSGRAMYVGISSYDAQRTAQAAAILKSLGTPCLIHQPLYNMMNRWVEQGLSDVLLEEGIGCIPYCPLAQGLLTARYLQGIQPDSRAAKPHGFLKQEQISADVMEKVRALSEIASARDQSLAQMSLAWLLNRPAVTSCLIGVSRVDQLDENVAALKTLSFSDEELKQIDEVLGL